MFRWRLRDFGSWNINNLCWLNLGKLSLKNAYILAKSLQFVKIEADLNILDNYFLIE